MWCKFIPLDRGNGNKTVESKTFSGTAPNAAVGRSGKVVKIYFQADPWNYPLFYSPTVILHFIIIGYSLKTKGFQLDGHGSTLVWIQHIIFLYNLVSLGTI